MRILYGLVCVLCLGLRVSGFADPVPPAKVLDLARWKIQLPIDTRHPGHPDEVRPPELTGFVDPEHFFVDEKKGGVVFRAECGGATTRGSHYPRSELRELQEDGRSLADWSTDDKEFHTLAVRLAVTALPAVKDEVCCAQIHDSTTGALMVRLEGKKLLIKHSGGKSVVLDGAYKLGTPFDLKIQAGRGHVRVWFEGREALDWKTRLEHCYFKTGCYTQSNISKGDKPESYGEVILYQVSLESEPER